MRVSSRSALTHAVASTSTRPATRRHHLRTSLERQRPLAGRRHELVEHAVHRVYPPEPRQSRHREHKRVALTGGQLAQPRVDVASQIGPPTHRHAQRASAPRAAGCSFPPGLPEQARTTRHAPQRASRGSSRAGIATSARPGASSAGTSFAECTATSISPAEQSPLQLRDPPRLVADRTCRFDLHQRVLHPEPIRRPRPPARARARCRASRSGSTLLLAEPGRRESRSRTSPSRRRRARSRPREPNRSRISAIRAWTRSSLQLLEPRGRRGAAAGSRSRARARRPARGRVGDADSHFPAFSATTSSAISLP